MKKLIVFALLGLIGWPLAALNADIDLPEIGDSAGALISPQQEYRIGQGFFWQIQQSVDLVDDPELTSYLQSLGYRLVSNNGCPVF